MTAFLKIILFPFKLIGGFYAVLFVAGLIAVPAGYALAPAFHFAKNMPAASRETILMAVYLPMALAGVFIIIDFLLPQVPDQEPDQAPASPLLLQDHAPWLQSSSIAEDEAEAPSLSPPRKSLPAPGPDSGY